MEKFWKCPPVGSQMGSGKLDTMDSKVLFVGPQGRSILLTDNANGRDGLWQVNWWECIIDNKFIDYQDREAAGCGDMDPEIQTLMPSMLPMAFRLMKQLKPHVKN